MNCNHEWVKTQKKPSRENVWFINNGEAGEEWYHIYKCAICGEETEMSEKEANSSKDNAALQYVVKQAVGSDEYWLSKINEFLNALNNISFDYKELFMIRLINDKDKFNEFKKELTKPYDASELYESYK